MLTQLPDLTPYFDRIAYQSDPRPDLATLEALHWLHPNAIAFENLSPLLGEPVVLETDALLDKLIRRRRGGYCFEQNTLFMHALELVGFDVVPLAARVVWNRDRDRPNPRTHMVILVSIDDIDYLCDVGFGGVTLTAPLVLEPDKIQTTPHEAFRIREIGREFVLEVNLDDEWRQTYLFDLQPQLPVDYEAMNHFVQTHASSPFTQTLMAARPLSTSRFTLRGSELRRYEAGVLTESSHISRADDLATVLEETFGIALPSDKRLEELLGRVVTGSAE